MTPSTQRWPKDFLKVVFFVHVDDIAVVTNNANNMQRVLKRIQELSLILGFHTNPGKTEVYKWATTLGRGKRGRCHNIMYSDGMASTYWCDPPYLDI